MTKDEQAIGEMVRQLEAAWNAADSKAWASNFTDDASFIHIYGGRLDGRAAIEMAHRQIFDGIYKGSHNNYALQDIRFVRPDVAVVHVKAHLKFYEGGEPRDIHALPTMIALKDDGNWQVAAFQNTRVSEMPKASQVSSAHAS